MGHFRTGLRVFEETRAGGNNPFLVRAYEQGSARLHGFGPFRGIAHDEHGLAEMGRLFLNAAGIGEQQAGAVHGPDEGFVGQWFDEVHVFAPGQQACHGFAHVGVEVNGIDEFAAGEALSEARDGATDGLETAAEIFAAMPGDEHHQPVIGEPRCRKIGRQSRRARAHTRHHEIKSVNDGVARNPYTVFFNALGKQVVTGPGRRREMEIGEAGNHLAVCLFGPGGEAVPGAQARLDMGDPHTGVERGEGRGKGGGGVALHDEHVRPLPGKGLLEAAEYGGGDIRGGLPWTHDLKVAVGRQRKRGQGLVKQFPVLAGGPELGRKTFRLTPQPQVQRGELDDLRPGAHDQRGLQRARHERRSRREAERPAPSRVTSNPAVAQARWSSILRVS